MKKACSLILVLCLLCVYGLALAEEWKCANCGSTASGNFCSNCGAKKSDEEVNPSELNGDMLTYYYLNAVLQNHDAPYLTNIMRWRNGQEETSALAVAIRDPETETIGILANADIVSEGCNYSWQCGTERFPVLLSSSQEMGGLVCFELETKRDEARVLEKFDIPCAGSARANETMALVYYVLDEENESLTAILGKVQLADIYEDFGNYQILKINLGDDLFDFVSSFSEISTWNEGLYGILVNGSNNVCGIFINGTGFVSPTILGDETFSGNAQSPSTPASAREQVSDAAAVENAVQAKDSTAVQDMYDYMQKKMTFDSIAKEENGQQYRKFKGGSDSYTLVSRYVEALCAQSNFELSDSYYSQIKSTFFSFALKYTGSGKVSSDKPEMNFKDNVYGDVTIYGTVDGSTCKGYIYIVSGLAFDDLGLRADGSNASTAQAGQSLNADLYRLSDGSYETSDGRFHVKAGQAMVYRDGSVYTTDATLLRDKDKNREELQIYNFYRNDSILLTLPYNSVLTGDVFNRRTIGYNTNSSFDQNMKSMESFLGWKFSNQILGVCHNNDYLLCYTDDKNDFDDISIRVLYWDTEQQEAVFYIYASFDTAPYVYEAVAAARMETAQNRTDSGGSDDDELFVDCSYCNGDGRCDTCGGSGKVNKWVGDQYMTVDCTALYCLNGRCTACSGTGHR